MSFRIAVAIVIWMGNVKSVIHYEGLMLEEEDGTTHIGIPYCIDCIPRGYMKKYIYVRIEYDYGFKNKCYCSVCGDIIAIHYDRERGVYIPGRSVIR